MEPVWSDALGGDAPRTRLRAALDSRNGANVKSVRDDGDFATVCIP